MSNIKSAPSADGDAAIRADVAAINRIAAVPSILNVICRVTGMGFAAVARVDGDSWTACAVRDDIGFGLQTGGQLELATTICDEIRDSRQPVLIDHVAEDPEFRDHHTPKLYGFQSYISVPIARTNGDFFGTLCAIDPKPARLKASEALATFKLFAELIGLHLEAEQQIAESKAALLDAEQTSELRDQFIAVLGHDLRNPLAAIESGTRLIGGTPLNDRATIVLGMMQDSCRRMSALISDVLDFARGRLGGGLPVDRRVHDTLGPALEQVVAEMRTAYPKRTIRLDIALTEPVACDPPRLAQLLSNLLANAITHGDPDGPVEVRGVSCDGLFNLSVANRGQPIPEDKQARLFQPFTRSDDGRPHKGLGLGLYIAAEIARAHGGEIEVISTPGETRFTLAMANGLRA